MFAAETADTTKPLPRRWLLRSALTLGGLLILLWLAPMLASWSPLRSWLCAHAEHYLDGSVSIGSMSLGWFSPVVLYNVELRDEENQSLVQIQKVATDQTLLHLLLFQEEWGSLRLESPKVFWNFQGKESNLERHLAKLLRKTIDLPAHTPTAGTALPRLQLEIIDGTVVFHDADTKLSWQVYALAIDATLFNDAARTVQMKVQGALHDGNDAGLVNADIQLAQGADGSPSATIQGRFSSLSLALANVLLRRSYPGLNLTGSLQGFCQLDLSVKDGQPCADLSGEAIASHVRLSAPFLAEPLQIDRVAAPCRVKLDGQRLTLERAEIDSELGKASLQATFDLRQDGLAMIDQPAFALAVDVNLATLAERLPKTLHLHEDIRLTTGKLNLACKSSTGSDGVIWQAKLRSTDVRGVKGKYTIAWPEPIQFEVQARHLSQGVPLIDQLQCTSRFLTMQATSSADQFTFTTEVDMQQLVDPLGEFIALDSFKLAGKAKATMSVRRLDQDRFTLQGNAQLQQVDLTWLTQKPWREPLVTAQFSAEGQLDRAGRQRIDSAALEANLGGDTVQLQLIEPIADVGAGPWGVLALRAEGDLARWQNRARSWTTVGDAWQLAGQTLLQMRLRPARQTIDCTDVVFQAAPFRLTAANLWMQEADVKLQTSARWDAQAQRLDLGATKLTSQTLAVETGPLVIDAARGTLQGTAQITGEVARLRQWLQDPGVPPGTPMDGIVSARIQLQANQDQIRAEGNGTIKNLLYGPANDPLWREPEVKYSGVGTYDRAKEVVRLEQIQFTGATLSAKANGTVAHLATTKDIELNGNLSYDLAFMKPQLQALLGNNVTIAGKDTRSFRLTGPLYPKGKSNVISVSLAGTSLSSSHMHFTDLKGEAGLSWNTLQAHGCNVGPAEVKAILQQGWLQLYPIETSLNGGKLRLQPNLRLEPAPAELILLPGKMIERAQLTPEMCAGALGYALPLLANIATVDGVGSLTLEGGRIPLAAPKTGEIKGTLLLHSAKLGASPIIAELSSLLKMPPPVSMVKECPVAFHMVGGKVHHSGLVLAFPDFTMTSSGTVGLDGTLGIVVEMPIPPRLAAAARLTPHQAKQTIRIPIGGTVDRPRPDPRALESLTATVGRSVLENELNKLLQPK